MRKLLIAAMMLSFTGFAALAAPTTYSSESAAKRACGSDPVVWANLNTKVLHPSGDKYYGKTKDGAYACQSAATREGMHMDKSKQ